jgi:hypothetical protein
LGREMLFTFQNVGFDQSRGRNPVEHFADAFADAVHCAAAARARVGGNIDHDLVTRQMIRQRLGPIKHGPNARVRARKGRYFVEFPGFSPRPEPSGDVKECSHTVYRLHTKKRPAVARHKRRVARHVERPRVRSKNAYIALVTAFVSACSLANSRPRRTRVECEVRRGGAASARPAGGPPGRDPRRPAAGQRRVIGLYVDPPCAWTVGGSQSG